jgi:Na+/H+-translocating membrane pyrophosphatase
VRVAAAARNDYNESL